MSIYLMLVICMPDKPSCVVQWSGAHFKTTEECVANAAPAYYSAMNPYVEGAFCEIGKRAPKDYIIGRDELPH